VNATVHASNQQGPNIPGAPLRATIRLVVNDCLRSSAWWGGEEGIHDPRQGPPVVSERPRLSALSRCVDQRFEPLKAEVKWGVDWRTEEGELELGETVYGVVECS